MAHSHDKHTHHNAGFDPVAAGKYLGRAFTIGIVLNLAFVAVEFIAGVVLDSIALMSDAGHNLSDVVALVLSLMAFKLAQQKPSARYTYGRKRSTIVVALANACLLFVVVGAILWGSIGKIQNPQPVEGGAIAWVAGAGIVVNSFTAWLFMRYRKSDLNVKGAYLHMAADALVSVGVLVSGIIIHYTDWYIIDPIIGMVIALIILVSTWKLFLDSLRLSLDAVPEGLDMRRIEKAITDADARIKGVHHIHVWALSTTENALTAHVVVDSLQGVGEIKRRIKDDLKHHGIVHSTLELELPDEEECIDCGI